MKKKPFSFFLELLFVLFFFLITSTILIEIYAKMMQVSKEDTYRQEAMIIAQNEIETHTRVGDYTRKMNDMVYDIKIKRINDNEFCIQIYVKEKLVQYERRLKREEKEYRDKRNYVVFDLETTGLSPINNEITEIGAVKVIDGKISDTFEMLVKPNQKISQKITDITGITNEMVKDKPPIEEVLPKFIEFIGGLPLVAHNIEFDYGFLCENYNRVYKKEFKRKKSCTMKMYRKWYKDQYDENAPCAKLGDVVLELLGNEEYLSYLSNSHRGLNDAEFTQKVYENLI